MIKSILAAQITGLHYPKHDVLADNQSRVNRLTDLNSAQAVSSMEREEVGLIVQLESGEEIEILSDLIDVGQIHVEVKGGHLIPITAILRIEI